MNLAFERAVVPRNNDTWKLFRTPLVVLKTANLLLGIVVVVLGLCSYFASYWTTKLTRGNPLYTQCDFKCFMCSLCKSRPHIFLEQYYVATVSICFALLLLNLLWEWISKVPKSRWSQVADMAFHSLVAAIMLSAATAYILAAIQMGDFIQSLESKRCCVQNWNSVYFRLEEKIAAGVLTIVEAGVCLAVACDITRSLFVSRYTMSNSVSASLENKNAKKFTDV